MLAKQYAAIFLLSLISLNEGSRILVWFPMFSKSHSLLGKQICTHLLEAGHEIVHVTSFPREEKHANLTEVVSANLRQEFEKMLENNDQFKLSNMVGQKNFGDSLFFFYMTYQISRITLEDKAIIEFLSDPTQKFDAVILEWFFSDYIAGIAPLFQAPLIWVSSTEAHWQALKLIGEIPNPAYNVDIFSASKPPLTFLQRLEELWIVVKKYVVINTVIVPFEKRIYNNIFSEFASKRGVTIPAYNDAVYNGSLMFINSHPSMGTPFSLPQNAKYVGGYHVDTKVKPLPKDLQKILDETKHGVIYFSMGSNLKSADMTDHMKQSLLKMFSTLKQDVIWKFESDLENVPANVHLVKWAPQQSILAHRNLKMFITHGGQLSTTEAIHHGVPVVGIPVLGDQKVNMQSAVDKEFGIKVTLAEDMADDILKAINEIIDHPIYSLNAKRLSALYHDRPLSPGQSIVYWVEHVIRSKGARHLGSTGVLVPMYQRLYLDLIAIVGILLYVLNILWKRLFKRRNATTQKREKKSKVN